MKKEETNIYWVMKGDDEYPKGVLFENRDDAVDYSKEMRENGFKTYVRKIRLTKKEFLSVQEI